MTDQPEQRDFPVTFLGDFSRKLIVNTFFNLLGRFWSFAAAILLTPFIWGHLTRGEFGVWVLLSVFLESFTLLDFGLGSAFVKFISAYYTHDDYRDVYWVSSPEATHSQNPGTARGALCPLPAPREASTRISGAGPSALAPCRVFLPASQVTGKVPRSRSACISSAGTGRAK